MQNGEEPRLLPVITSESLTYRVGLLFEVGGEVVELDGGFPIRVLSVGEPVCDPVCEPEGGLPMRVLSDAAPVGGVVVDELFVVEVVESACTFVGGSFPAFVVSRMRS